MAITPSELQLIIRAKDEASKTLKGVMGSTKELDASLGTMSKGASLANKALSTIVTGLGIGSFTMLAQKAASVAMELAAVGRQSERINTAFVDQWGEQAPDAMQKLRDASLGAISDMDLQLAANRAMMLEVTTDADQLAGLLQAATERGRALGVGTTQAFNDIVTGIGRESKMILDNEGYVYDAEQLYAEYAATLGKTAEALIGVEKKQALVNMVLEQSGTVAADSATAHEALAAAKANLRSELGLLIDAFIEESGAVETLTGKLNALRSAMEFERNASAAASDMSAAFTANLERQISAAGMNEQLYQRMTQGQRSLEVALRDGRITAEQYQAGINKLDDELRAATGQMSRAEIEAANLQESLVRNMAAGFQAARGFDAAGSAASRMALQMAAAAKVQYSPYGYQVYGSAQGSYEAVQSRVEYLQIENERRVLERQMEGGRQEQLELQAKAAQKSVDIAQDQFDDIRGIIESALSPTAVTAADLAATAAGTYVDKWDEYMRRIRMPESGMDAAQIAEQERLFYSGQMMDQVNWGAIVSDVQRKVQEEAGKEAMIQEAMRQVQAAGITASEAQLASAMGITDYQGMGRDEGAAIAKGITAMGLGVKFTDEFTVEFDRQQDKWVTLGRKSVGWMALGMEQGATPQVTELLVNLLVPRLYDALTVGARP
jgi:hypothetical protein